MNEDGNNVNDMNDMDDMNALENEINCDPESQNLSEAINLDDQLAENSDDVQEENKSGQTKNLKVKYNLKNIFLIYHYFNRKFI